MFDYMMEKTDPRYINYEMDVFWIRNPGQNPAAIMRKYPNRFKLTHLKDRMIGSVDNQNGRQDKERNVVPAVSYTHLDVYKRQVSYRTLICIGY